MLARLWTIYGQLARTRAISYSTVVSTTQCATRRPFSHTSRALFVFRVPILILHDWGPLTYGLGTENIFCHALCLLNSLTGACTYFSWRQVIHFFRVLIVNCVTKYEFQNEKRFVPASFQCWNGSCCKQQAQIREKSFLTFSLLQIVFHAMW